MSPTCISDDVDLAVVDVVVVLVWSPARPPSGAMQKIAVAQITIRVRVDIESQS
jgi:hypothetical protein